MKDKLLDVAIRHFGIHGFDGAATRAIAADAETAMSSITYHYGGKEGLYLACADQIAEGLRERIFPLLDRFENADLLDRGAAASALSLILAGFARTMLDPVSEDWSRFIAREQQAPTAAFERLYEGVMKRVIQTVVRLVAQARPDLDDQEARATAATLWGQAIVLRMGRASVARVLEVESIDEAVTRLLVERVVANARCILSADPENNA